MSPELRQLLADLEAKKEQKDKIVSEAKALNARTDVSIDEINAKTEELKKINAEIEALNKKIETQKLIDNDIDDEGGIELQDTLKSKPITDKYGTLEYRQAFRDYCLTGRMSPLIKNADATTTTGDAAAVIPSTILQEIIQKVTSYGQLFARVRKLSVQGGVSIPILSLKPVATWIGETTPSDRQKVDLSQSISFSYYGLECKIATSLLANTVTLDMFERTLVDLIGEAMTKALDLAIVKGAGTASPLGITVDSRVPAANVVTLSPTDFTKWDAWKKKVFAKMPLAYKGGATFIMASGTFEGYIDGMTDSNGQPIGRVNYGIANGPQESFGGKPVILVEDDIIANYDDAATGEVVAIYGNLNNYAINSNMQMTMYRYLDQDKNEWVDKAILIADGKLIDPNGIIIIKKGAAS